MHKEARLFAISSNTHDIHIYAFALGRGLDEDSSSDSGDDTSDLHMESLVENADWNDLNGPPALHQRTSQNLRIVLRGHQTNIPNISFCNTEADADGRYLISTDIEDSNHVWDIWQQNSICDFTFTKNPNTESNYSVGTYVIPDIEIGQYLLSLRDIPAQRMGYRMSKSLLISMH